MPGPSHATGPVVSIAEYNKLVDYVNAILGRMAIIQEAIEVESARDYKDPDEPEVPNYTGMTDAEAEAARRQYRRDVYQARKSGSPLREARRMKRRARQKARVRSRYAQHKANHAGEGLDWEDYFNANE